VVSWGRVPVYFR